MGLGSPCTVNILIGLLSHGQIEPLSALSGLQEFLPFPRGQISWIFLGKNELKLAYGLTSLAGHLAVLAQPSRQIIRNTNVAFAVPQSAQNIERDGV